MTLDWFGLDGEAVGDLDRLVSTLVEATGTPPCRWTPGLDVEWLDGAELSTESGTLTLELGGIDVTRLLHDHVSGETIARLASLVEAGEVPVALCGLWDAYVEQAHAEVSVDVPDVRGLRVL